MHNKIKDITLSEEKYRAIVTKLKTKYRNPAAHTNELKFIQAQECFDMIVDVEKILKKMMDTFSY